jgi:hypothetical protein
MPKQTRSKGPATRDSAPGSSPLAEIIKENRSKLNSALKTAFETLSKKEVENYDNVLKGLYKVLAGGDRHKKFGTAKTQKRIETLLSLIQDEKTRLEDSKNDYYRKLLETYEKKLSTFVQPTQGDDISQKLEFEGLVDELAEYDKDVKFDTGLDTQKQPEDQGSSSTLKDLKPDALSPPPSNLGKRLFPFDEDALPKKKRLLSKPDASAQSDSMRPGLDLSVQTEPVPQDVEMLAQPGQGYLPPQVPDIVGQQPSVPGMGGEPVSGQAFIQESLHNQNYFDDTQLLANIATNYDSLNRPALAALGAEVTYRRERPDQSTNEFRESLYGPRISGGDIRQMNRWADTDLRPMRQHVFVKLTQLRNDMVSFLDTFIDEPEPSETAYEYQARPNDVYEYDPMEVQIPVEREKIMESEQHFAGDNDVNPQAMARNILIPEFGDQRHEDETFRLVQRGSGEYIIKKLRQAKLKKLIGPYSALFTAMFNYMNNTTQEEAGALNNVSKAIDLFIMALQSYQISMDQYTFNGIMLSCGVTKSAIDSYMYNMRNVARNKIQLQMYDQKMREGIAPSFKSYAPY